MNDRHDALPRTDYQPRDPDFEARCRDSFAQQTIMGTFGGELVALGPGACVIEMPFNPSLTQQNGYLHAGVAATLADNAGGYAAHSLSAREDDILAVEFKINLLSPAVGEQMRAVGRCLRNGRSLSVNEVEVYALTGGEAKLIAKMQQTTIRVPAKAELPGG